MKKREQGIKDNVRDEVRDESLLTYGRPSVSAWIAAAAVAFAFFILGGFIKTYRQMEAMREEYQYEIADLRETVRRLREDRVVLDQRQAGRGGPGYQAPRLEALPPARRESGRDYRDPRVQQSHDYGTQGYGAPQQPMQQQPQSHSLRPVPPPDFLNEFEDSVAERPRYQVGRTYEGGDARLLGAGGGAAQVISVSSDRKRVIVEGGRDLGLSEGARLELCRDGRWAADLRVLDVYDNQSSCEVLHATTPPQPGDTIRRAPQSR